MSNLKNLYANLSSTDEISYENLNHVDKIVNEVYSELSKSSKKATKLNNDINTLDEVSSGIESMVDELQELANNGDCLTFESAVFAHHAVNTYLKRISLTSEDTIPSMESFALRTTSMEATNFFKKKLKKIVKNTKNTLETARGNVTSVYNKLFDDTTKALAVNKSNINRLLKECETIKKTKDKINISGKMVVVSGALNLRYKDSIDFNNIIEGMKVTVNCLTMWYPKFVRCVDDIQEKRLDLVKKLDKGFSGSIEQLLAPEKTIINNFVKKNGGRAALLSGDYMFKWEDIGRPTFIKSYGTDVSNFENTTDLIKVDQIEQILTKSMALITNIISILPRIKKDIVEGSNAKFIKELVRIRVDKQDKPGVVGNDYNYGLTAMYSRTSSNNYLNAISLMIMIATNVSKSAIQYSEQSLKRYNSK